MYLLKTKGTGKINDYIQIRDKEFRLLSVVVASNALKEIEKKVSQHNTALIKRQLEQLEYGKILKLEI